MSRFTKLDLDELPVAPRDDLGHFVGKECPECGNGKLVYEGNGHWRCDGLADPEDDNKPLDACAYQHDDGDPATPQKAAKKEPPVGWNCFKAGGLPELSDYTEEDIGGPARDMLARYRAACPGEGQASNDSNSPTASRESQG